MGTYKVCTTMGIAPLLAVVLLSVSSCATIRLVTYPGSFVWIDGDEVRNTMHTMAASIGNIERLITSETSIGENQEQILGELEALEITAQSLAAGNEGDEGGSATNHLLIDDHLDEFTESLLLAQLQVQAMPPNYYRAGTLIGSCNACHRFR